MAALIFILILSVLVLIHEFGHFLVARRNKIKVLEFGLGYPPRLIKLFKWRETLFSLNAIPFGGFVQLEGEDGPAFYQHSIKARMAVTLAGVVFNFIFGIVAFAIVFAKIGIPVDLHQQPRIAAVTENSPAATAGLKADSNIVAFFANDQWVEVGYIKQVQDFVAVHQGETVKVRMTTTCQQEFCPTDYTEHDLYLRTAAEVPEGEGVMGVTFTETLFKQYPWYQMPFYTIVYAFKQSIALGLLILQTLWQLVADLLAGRGVQSEVAGPIGIIDQASTYGFFDGGFLSILNFAALLSINLGIMYLLPIPALDGGRAVLLVLEKIFKRQRIEKIAHYLNYFGYIFLPALMLVVSFNDIKNIFI